MFELKGEDIIIYDNKGLLEYLQKYGKYGYDTKLAKRKAINENVLFSILRISYPDKVFGI